MGKFTVEEKEVLLDAMDHYIDAGEKVRQILTGNDKGEFTLALLKIEEIRAKLILDTHPIEAKSNNMLSELTCYLCGEEDSLGYPKTPMIDGHDICSSCFEKYAPELYEKTCEVNRKCEEKENKGKRRKGDDWMTL